MSLTPASISGALLSSGALLFAAAPPSVLPAAEDLTISVAKVIGIIGAVAVGSWTTSRKLKAIEDAIAEGSRDRQLMRRQISGIQTSISEMACVRARRCPKRVPPKRKS